MPKMPGEAEENEDTTQDDGTEETEDTSTEETNDTESETDDSEEGTSDDQESESQDKGKDKNVFNPNNLPDELKPIWKRMQAHLTRKHQAYSAGIKKADMWDRLIQTPEFRKWYQDFSSGGSSTTEESDDQGGEGAQDNAMSQRLTALETNHFHMLAEREFKDFAESHPDWSVYQQEIYDLMEMNEKLTYEQAYRLATYDKSEERGQKQGIQKLSSKKRANLSKPTGSGRPPQQSGGAKTIREAAEMAERQLGMRK